jgi:hypothetical protein
MVAKFINTICLLLVAAFAFGYAIVAIGLIVLALIGWGTICYFLVAVVLWFFR